MKLFYLFSVIAVLSLVLMFVVSVEGKFSGCQCHFIGDCVYDEQGYGMKYYFCGNCNAYSGWRYHQGCPIKTVNSS